MVTQVKERNVKVAVSKRNAVRLPFGLKAHELVAAVAVLIFFVLTTIFYFWTLKPKEEELASLERQLETLKKTEAEAILRIKQKDAPPVEDKGKEALNSLDYFKGTHLKPISQGRIALINDINAMAKKNGVTLMSGIDMVLDRAAVSEDGKDESKRKSRESFLRVFPNLSMRFTVSGDYQSLRKFISDLEANKQFKTIESINLNTIKETEGTRTNRRTRVAGIALTIDMTAFFYPESR